MTTGVSGTEVRVRKGSKMQKLATFVETPCSYVIECIQIVSLQVAF